MKNKQEIKAKIKDENTFYVKCVAVWQLCTVMLTCENVGVLTSGTASIVFDPLLILSNIA
jgi:hypothetical protein